MDLSIIIINWNSAEYLRNCLRSIFEHTRDLDMEVIVLDNASFDGSREVVQEQFPQVRFIQSEANLGFAKGNNSAVRQAHGSWLLFLNPDTELLGPAINRLLETGKTLPRVGALGARLLNSDGTLQKSCVQAFPSLAKCLLDADILRQWFPKARVWGNHSLYSTDGVPVPVEGICGACLMTARSTFDRIGGFEEDYFMYVEDLEYCLKAQKAGLQNYYVPKAVLIHHGGKSSTQVDGEFASVMISESGWRFFQKEHGSMWALAYRCCLVVKAVSRLSLIVLVYPLASRPDRRERLRAALCKSLSIGRWAIGGERWANDK